MAATKSLRALAVKFGVSHETISHRLASGLLGVTSQSRHTAKTSLSETACDRLENVVPITWDTPRYLEPLYHAVKRKKEKGGSELGRGMKRASPRADVASVFIPSVVALAAWHVL